MCGLKISNFYSHEFDFYVFLYFYFVVILYQYEISAITLPTSSNVYSVLRNGQS